MKKNSIAKLAAASKKKAKARKKKLEELSIGIDIGDRYSSYCVLDENGEKLLKERTPTTVPGLKQVFGNLQRSRIAIEAGPHSAWMERVLRDCGHVVVVANTRAIPAITASDAKNDDLDAEMLARLVRVDPRLLQPIRHRGPEAHAHLMVIRSRRVLVETRTKLMNAARGLVKPLGERLEKCCPAAAGLQLTEGLSEGAAMAVEPLLCAIETLNEQIRIADERIESIAQEHYNKEVRCLTQIKGVGTLVAMTFVLTLEDAGRFKKSRDVGCYIGARPKRNQSGDSDPELGITKKGDKYLRCLLINSAQYILGRFGPDTDLRRWGLGLAGRGGKNAKKRAVVAVARKLSILLHRLWVTGAEYEPLRNSQAKRVVAA